MPTWFYNRPTEQADPTEALVAQVFDQLEGDWYIRWGYFYQRGEGDALRDREGDFILLGPSGHILVVEVKSGLNRHFALTGEWEHGDDHPAHQLFSEWKAVIEDLEANYTDGRVPFVGKALCLPHVNLTEQDRITGELSRDQLIFRKDLENFPAWWKDHLSKHKTSCSNPKKAFHAALAKGLQPAKVQLFLKQSDLLFDRFKATEFEILAMLQENRQWLVEGGVGSGKTFMALQQAKVLAEEGNGKRVLFLVYNLLLASRLHFMAGRLNLKRGEVVVRSWESLLGDIIATQGVQLEIPEGREAVTRYFTEEVPAYVEMALAEGTVQPEFDALVVDEAQDHDTQTLPGQVPDSPGWWAWYFALLREGAHSPMALFYDPAQRPDFRGPDQFCPDSLRAALSQPVHIRLRKSLRYTQPILRYLQNLKASGTERLRSSLAAHEDLPTGPEVDIASASGIDTAQAIERILRDWKRKGLCNPTDAVLIGPRRFLADSSLGETPTLLGFPIRDYDESQSGILSYIGAHRSKGMDFLAVVVIDFRNFQHMAEDPAQSGFQEAFFMAASRARQLLAVVSLE